VYNIQVQNFAGPPAANVTLENNWFGCPVNWLYVSDTSCNNQADLQFNASSSFSNWLVRYNSFAAGIGEYVPGASFSNVRIVGNAGGRSECLAGITSVRNAWAGSGCSSTDVDAGPLIFVSRLVGQEDFHLLPGSQALNLVADSSSDAQLNVDIEGRARPAGSARDAGATEDG
jgi:hypothetical protein